jgi:adenylate kinase
MKTILVTGTPGTGKSFIARKLSLFLHYKYFDIGKFVKEAKIYASFDKKRDCYVVDEQKLADELIKVRQKAIKAGERRLTKRGYSASKVRENLDAEIFDTCLTEAAERGHKVLLFSTTKTSIPAIKILAKKIRLL